jgi:RNA polymerase sigma-70 factor (family 1)
VPVTSLYNEKEVLQRLAEGAEPAFRLIYDHYRNMIFSKAFRITGSEAAAHDVIQDIFVKLWLNRGQLKTLDNFNAYLNAMIQNHLSNQFRKLAIENTYVRYLLEGTEHLVNGEVTDPVLFREINRLYAEAIDRLSPRQRSVYLLGKKDGLTYEAIAAELHISKDTVKEYMTDAMRSIRQYLAAHEYDLILLAVIAGVHGVS